MENGGHHVGEASSVEAVALAGVADPIHTRDTDQTDMTTNGFMQRLQDFNHRSMNGRRRESVTPVVERLKRTLSTRLRLRLRPRPHGGQAPLIRPSYPLRLSVRVSCFQIRLQTFIFKLGAASRVSLLSIPARHNASCPSMIKPYCIED